MYLNDSYRDVISKLRDVKLKYSERRVLMDNQRVGGNWRPLTTNKARITDCLFIQKVVQWAGHNIFDYSDKYKSYDPHFNHFRGKVPCDPVASFLREAMLGAMILTILKITRSYTNSNCCFWQHDESSVKNQSALAYVLLNEFNLGKASEVDPRACRAYLTSLSRLITVVDEGHENNMSLEIIQWHPSFSNDILLQQLKDEMTQIETITASSRSEYLASEMVAH